MIRQCLAWLIRGQQGIYQPVHYFQTNEALRGLALGHLPLQHLRSQLIHWLLQLSGFGILII